jgi:hypothetical protein
MKALKSALLVVLVLSLALWLGLAIACTCDSDDNKNPSIDDDSDDDLDDNINYPPTISPSECDALITQIYDICQTDVNTWVRDEALGYCYGGGNADWVCLKGCTDQFANDCWEIFSCSVANCS